MKQPSTHRSLERGLALLEAVAAADKPASLAETARRLGLHRSTAHHLMQTLVGAGYLRQEKSSRGYELTPKLYQLTGRLWNAEQLRAMAQPYLEDLMRATGEGTSFAAWLDGGVTIVAKREAEVPVRVVQDVGGQRPIYCTAVGKAIAAWLRPSELRVALGRTRMQRLTPKTITTQSAFDAELRRIRAAGYAMDDEEQFEGLRCIAMPVFCYTGGVLGAVCVLGPKQRMTQQKILAAKTPLADVAGRLSERLGYAHA
ncbi:MAG TPA: IclR family transcriptional regulator [Burkholderiales bacterium]|nr:IclR family transcriptional regulator [Burkholderiales bacterium]